MVHVIAIRDGDHREASVCCSRHARTMCQRDAHISWWEIFDVQGNMVDSADKAIEDEEDEDEEGDRRSCS